MDNDGGVLNANERRVDAFEQLGKGRAMPTMERRLRPGVLRFSSAVLDPLGLVFFQVGDSGITGVTPPHASQDPGMQDPSLPSATNRRQGTTDWALWGTTVCG